MTIRDFGLNKILREFRTLSQSEVAVGIVGDVATQAHPNGNGLTFAEVATVNEYGSADGRIPERPAHRNAAETNQAAIGKNIQLAILDVLNGTSTAQQAMDKIGVWYTGKVKKSITDLRTPPNAPPTVQRKGSSNPLIDTGRTRNSVAHIVRKLTTGK